MSQRYGRGVPGTLRSLKRSSVLGHDRPREFRSVTVRGQSRQGIRDLSITAIDRMKIPIRGHRRGVTEPTHQILDRSSRGCRKRLARMAQIVKPEARDV